MLNIAENLEKIIENIPTNKSRNVLYDLSLLHMNSKKAKTNFYAMLVDLKNLNLYKNYSAASFSFIQIPDWVCELASDNEIPFSCKQRLKKVSDVFKLIRKIESPLLDRYQRNIVLEEKIGSLWAFIESEVESILIETIIFYDISGQMSSFNKNNCTHYVKNIMDYSPRINSFDGEDDCLPVLNNFVNFYYSKVESIKVA